MDNAARILETFDKHLDHPVRLVLYGRAALQLGFDHAPPAVAQSKDVDCIIPMPDVELLNEDMGFWDAQTATNDKLKSEGLYITHLFPADQVFLRRDWERYLVQIARPPLKWLRLFRPATIDLILSKMMRGNDPQDMGDAEFMIRQDRISEAQLRQAFLEMNPVELVELRDAFDLAKPIVLKLAREVSAA